MPRELPKSDQAETFKNESYLVLRKIVPETICSFGIRYFWLLKNAGILHRGDNLVRQCWCGYGVPFSETLLSILCEPLSGALRRKLLPTYSYSRIYLAGAEMKEHTDRPSCEISGTLTLGYNTSEPWSLFVKNRRCETLDIRLCPGDMLIYRGTDLPHWREKWVVPEDCWQVQVFFHFVDAEGPLKHLMFDERPYLGMRKTTEVRR